MSSIQSLRNTHAHDNILFICKRQHPPHERAEQRPTQPRQPRNVIPLRYVNAVTTQRTPLRYVNTVTKQRIPPPLRQHRDQAAMLTYFIGHVPLDVSTTPSHRPSLLTYFIGHVPLDVSTTPILRRPVLTYLIGYVPLDA